MAKISRNRRRFDIRKKQKRQRKLKKLRELFINAKTARAKDAILEKLSKIAPHLSEQEFLSPLDLEKKDEQSDLKKKDKQVSKELLKK